MAYGKKSNYVKPESDKSTRQILEEQITEIFIKGLEKGQIPWQRGWKNGKSSFGGKWAGFISESVNVVSNKHYQGINAMILDSFGLDVPVWGKFEQWIKNGVCVKKGEKGTKTVFWNISFKDENNKYLTRDEYNLLPKEKQNKCVPIFTLRYDTLFNITQVDGEKYPELLAKWTAKMTNPKTENQPETPETVEPFHHEAAEEIVSKWDVKLVHINQSRAYYSPTFDQITMPEKVQFEDLAMYYETLFHEGVHASGHKSRLKREGIVNGDGFGNDKYSFEELVAEIGSAFVCSHLGIEQHIENKIAYVNNWAQKLGENPDWIIKAASQATKATTWVLSWLDTEPSPTVEAEPVEVEEMEMA